jgi:hypothetical protein
MPASRYPDLVSYGYLSLERPNTLKFKYYSSILVSESNRALSYLPEL